MGIRSPIRKQAVLQSDLVSTRAVNDGSHR